MKRKHEQPTATLHEAIGSLIDEPDFTFSPPIPPAIQRLLDLLPEGQFRGTLCASTLMLMQGPIEENGERFSYETIVQEYAALEQKRLLVRFGALNRQPMFLIFGSPISASLCKAIHAHVDPQVLTLPLRRPPTHRPELGAPLRVKAKAETVEEFEARYGVDISPGGMFVRTDKPYPYFTQLNFLMTLRDGTPLFKGVVTVVEPMTEELLEEGEVLIRHENPEPGILLRFEQMTEASETLHREIVDRDPRWVDRYEEPEDDQALDDDELFEEELAGAPN